MIRTLVLAGALVLASACGDTGFQPEEDPARPGMCRLYDCAEPEPDGWTVVPCEDVATEEDYRFAQMRRSSSCLDDFAILTYEELEAFGQRYYDAGFDDAEEACGL